MRMDEVIEREEDREIVTTCVVHRQHMDAVALEFESLDWDDMIALARYLHPRLPD